MFHYLFQYYICLLLIIITYTLFDFFISSFNHTKSPATDIRRKTDYCPYLCSVSVG